MVFVVDRTETEKDDPEPRKGFGVSIMIIIIITYLMKIQAIHSISTASKNKEIANI